jgi:hypothetical protein
VIAPSGAGGDDAAAHGGVAIGPGKLARGAVVGLLQLLACNYGEVSEPPDVNFNFNLKLNCQLAVARGAVATAAVAAVTTAAAAAAAAASAV